MKEINMKKIQMSAALAAALLSTSAFAADVRIATEGAYAPWNFMDDSGKVAGFEVELGNVLCERAGVECEWVVNEWDSIIPNLVAGNYDVIMAGMSVTDERKETIMFGDEYFPADPSSFVAASSASIDFDNLKGLKIGAQGATIQAAYIEANLADGNDILTYESADQSVADLAAGNIDILLADSSFLAPVVEGSGGAMSVVGEPVTIGGGVAAGYRQADSELADKMNAALEEVRADGTLSTLLIEFFEKDPWAEQ